MSPIVSHLVKSYQYIWVLIALRYFILAGIGWLIWYKLIHNKVAYKKIQLHFPVDKDYRREILYSISTIFIFSCVPVLMLFTPFIKYTQHYQHIQEHGLAYFWLAFPLIFIIHDTYFYWMHRAMHHPALFKVFHLVHHKSVNPSPWAAFAFHPLEALVEVGAFVLLIMVMPTNHWHTIGFFLLMMVYNVYGHLGWELYPKGFSKHWLGRWLNTSVNHNQHHQYFKGNYGLYFLWWDRWMGTIRQDYDDKYEEVKNRDINTPAIKNGNKQAKARTSVLQEL